ncbi:MAG: radical SAM protein [Sulfuricella sp.]|nr:radical SAM protein [Sulfuricella sp.]
MRTENTSIGSPYLASELLRRPVKRVMLINPPGKITVTEHGSRERKLAVPPMGLAYLGAQLQRFGYLVDILDVLIEGYGHETASATSITYGLSEDRIRKRIHDFNPDVIGISCLFSNRGNEALHLCRIAKEVIPEAHVILGGQHPSGCPELVTQPFIDYMMWGEADNSLVELLDAINKGGDLAQVSQIVLKMGNGYWKSPRLNLPDVKQLPFPAWNLIRLDDYWEAGLADYEVSDQSEKRFMVMISSRGCPHDCFFCTAPMMTERRYRQRPLEDVFAEIRLYRERYGINEIHFWDDNFFINKKRTKDLLRGLVEFFPEMSFQVPSGSEINAIDDEVIDLMARAGFNKLFLAVESANEEIQESYIDKKVELGRIRQIVAKLKEVGIISEGSFMVGFPNETKEQVDATFRKAKEFGFDRISISLVNPLPGTGLYKICVEEGLFQPDFDPQNIRWSNESIMLEGVERGYLGKRRREVWLEYMQERIDIEKYEKQNIRKS